MTEVLGSRSADAIVIEGLSKQAQAMRETLAGADPVIANCLRQNNIRIRLLMPGEQFSDVGRKFRTSDKIDFGVCRGLYAPSDALIILRDPLPNVLIHEALHVLDFHAGDQKKPRSLLDDDVKRAYLQHRKDGLLISHYSGVNPLEFFAEVGRAACGFSESPPGRPTDLQRLQRIDPTLMTIVASFLDDARTKYAA